MWLLKRATMEPCDIRSIPLQRIDMVVILIAIWVSGGCSRMSKFLLTETYRFACVDSAVPQN